MGSIRDLGEQKVRGASALEGIFSCKEQKENVRERSPKIRRGRIGERGERKREREYLGKEERRKLLK